METSIITQPKAKLVEIELFAHEFRQLEMWYEDYKSWNSGLTLKSQAINDSLIKKLIAAWESAEVM